MERTHIWNPEIETMPWDEVRAIQEKKLKQQLAYVYERSEFYRQKFQAVGFVPGDLQKLEDLGKVPFTLKSELRESQIASPPMGRHMAADLNRVIRIHSPPERRGGLPTSG